MWHTGLTVSDSDKLEGIQKMTMKIAFPELSYECALIRANINTAVQSQKAVFGYFTSGQILPSGFARQNTPREELCLRFVRGLRNNPFTNCSYYSMAMVCIMRTSVCKIYSCESTQRLYQQLYRIDLTYQNKITNVDTMYAIRW